MYKTEDFENLTKWILGNIIEMLTFWPLLCFADSEVNNRYE